MLVSERTDRKECQLTRSVESFPLEDMAQMTAASSACDLDARHSEGPVFVADDCAWDSLEERWPAAPTLQSGMSKSNQNGMRTYIELGRALVERCSASGACINTFLLVLVVLPSPRAFSSFLAENAELMVDGEPDCEHWSVEHV